MNLFKKGKQSQMQKTNLWLPGGKLGRETGSDMYRLLYRELITNKDLLWVSQAALVVKSPAANAGDAGGTVLCLGQEQPSRRKWQPSPVFLPGESQRQQRAGHHGPQRGTELDTAEGTAHARARTWWIAEQTLLNALELPYIYMGK